MGFFSGITRGVGRLLGGGGSSSSQSSTNTTTNNVDVTVENSIDTSPLAQAQALAAAMFADVFQRQNNNLSAIELTRSRDEARRINAGLAVQSAWLSFAQRVAVLAALGLVLWKASPVVMRGIKTISRWIIKRGRQWRR